MDLSTRASTVFTLPKFPSPYDRSRVASVEEFEKVNNIENETKNETNICVVRPEIRKTSIGLSRVNELEVQLKMKEKIIEELLEENNKLVNNINSIELARDEERVRMQQGTERILQQVVEDNEWYKANFVELKNDLEKAIVQVKSKSKELSNLEKRCKLLIEEKDTLKQHSEKISAQYLNSVNQIELYRKCIDKIIGVTGKFIGSSEGYLPSYYGNSCNIIKILDNIANLLINKSNIRKALKLILEIKDRARDAEIEIFTIKDNTFWNGDNDIFELGVSDLDKTVENDYNIEKNNKDKYLEKDISIEKTSDSKLPSNILQLKYNFLLKDLEEAKNEIKKLRKEVISRGEKIEAMKKQKYEVLKVKSLDNSVVEILKSQIDDLKSEKAKLFKELSDMKNKESKNRKECKKSTILEKCTDSRESESDISYLELYRDTENLSIRSDYSCIQDHNDTIFGDNLDNKGIDTVAIEEYPDPVNYNNQYLDFNTKQSVDEIIKKYIKYPLEGHLKRQSVQKRLIQRNRYYS
ncbi:uncharacterized protein CMU_041950 [Cryptosporidium muris RN66]|uniref:Uncharacterized protein n=1 Tax=Cryptosporidium muris (strain RN66) TaxID=441375 RepID=B6AA81_CRYMR|nr:uncharacterized protein CMU_041950 [Cryptosporidium muris RN66]EEA05122.1 hypothetical protein, conserved [Cryptosporidium muris RN66]|eukprot:XP_002139471.1 hypothetical protein [Cryptosporidium muris RN66]